LDKVTAPLEGGFESKVRNLGNVSYIGSTEQLEATSQSLEAEARETECLRIIAEIPQLKEDLPILRGLPSTQFNSLKLVTFLLNQPNFSVIGSDAGSTIAGKLNFSLQEWNYISRILHYDTKILKIVKKDGGNRSQGEMLDIDAIIDRFLSSRVPIKVLPYMTDNLLRYIAKRANDSDVGFSEENKANYQDKIEEVIKLRSTHSRKIKKTKQDQNVAIESIEIYNPFKDPHFTHEGEILNGLSPRQLNYLKIVSYLIGQPGFTLNHPDNASGELVKRVGVDPKAWEDIKKKLQFQYQIISFIKQHEKATRSIGVTLNIDYLLDSNQDFITNGLLNKLRVYFQNENVDLTDDNKEYYLTKINSVLTKRARQPHKPQEIAAIKKARKLEREREYYYRRKSIKGPKTTPAETRSVVTKKKSPKKRTLKPKHKARIKALQPRTTETVKQGDDEKNRPDRNSVKTLKEAPATLEKRSPAPKATKTKRTRVVSKYKDLKFNFFIPEAGEYFNAYYRSKKIRNIKAMDRLLHAIGNSATFAKDPDHQLLNAVNLVNKHVGPEDTYSPEEVSGMMHQAEYQGLVIIKGSIFQLTKVALLVLQSRK
jgi:hypothetical protein